MHFVPEKFAGENITDYPNLIYEAREARDDAWIEYFEQQREVEQAEADLHQQAQNNDDLTNKSKRENWVTKQKSREPFASMEVLMHRKKRKANEANWRVQMLKQEYEILLTAEKQRA